MSLLIEKENIATSTCRKSTFIRALDIVKSKFAKVDKVDSFNTSTVNCSGSSLGKAAVNEINNTGNVRNKSIRFILVLSSISS